MEITKGSPSANVDNEKTTFLQKLTSKIGTQQLIILIVMFLLWGLFAVLAPAFRSFTTLSSLFDASYYVGFLGIGVTFVIITGGIDLSIGTGMMAAAMTGGVAYNIWHLPLAVSLLIILLVATLIGCLNGFLIAKVKLPPFIATLGTMMVAQGFSSIVSNIQTQTFPLRSSSDGWYKSLFRTGSSFPTGVILLLVMAVIAAVVLNKMRIGRYIFAIGSNREATKLSGINVVKYEASAYIIAGFFAGLAGIAYVATYTTIMPGAGVGFEMQGIAAAVVGGVSLAGGVGSILGTIIGTFIMTILLVGLPYVNLQPHWQLFITGIVVIVAVYVDIFRQRNKK